MKRVTSSLSGSSAERPADGAQCSSAEQPASDVQPAEFMSSAASSSSGRAERPAAATAAGAFSSSSCAGLRRLWLDIEDLLGMVGESHPLPPAMVGFLFLMPQAD